MRKVCVITAAMVTGAAAFAQPATTGPAQQMFETPQAAVDAMLDACRDNDSAALIRMLGAGYGEQLKKVDDAEERQHRLEVYEKAQAAVRIESESETKAVIYIGRERWPVPVPLVKESGGWRFDIEAGMEEMLARRVGQNELAAIEVCYDYMQFQIEYAAIDRDNDRVREFAQRLVSTEGNRDGLYWDIEPNSMERPSPMQALLPDYFGDLKNVAPGRPYMGYYFKILPRQGENPPGGKYDYVINGNMIAGFALVAWPADYRASGVMTFLISHQGTLLQKDLGPETAKLADAMSGYDPDASWTPVEPE